MMCLESILSIQFGKFQQILKFHEISLNISSVGKGTYCACRVVHMAQIVHPFIHSFCSCCKSWSHDNVFALLLFYLQMYLIH
jgi:hypothetical protein